MSSGSQTQIIQIGENGADIEMHITKTVFGTYFVGIKIFYSDGKGGRIQGRKPIPVVLFHNREEIYEAYGDRRR